MLYTKPAGAIRIVAGSLLFHDMLPGNRFFFWCNAFIFNILLAQLPEKVHTNYSIFNQKPYTDR